ncbi:ComEA family DNA-binding protein [Rhodothermus profundi]|uniref:Competence protein ComEA n=1 Tax=Rhodothermus profundi TaxID=633813 RepID=A0A1M6QP46_9BACT|nr:helix-hairpin-helix domain-containing protein [Rhodothermus profundi]SHK21860.1 competence protein ComEA [Rhodothermus profundi]
MKRLFGWLSRLSLTRTEAGVLLGLLALLLAGLVYRWWHRQQPAPPPTAEEAARFQEGAARMQQVLEPEPLNVNTATAEELERLPRIGPVLARRIVEYRKTHGPFRHVDELEAVPGIGPKTLQELRPLIRVE